MVHQIFTWRVVERLGYAAIATRLNADLNRYPPPASPDPARRRECWGRSSVYEILKNPKYTGYMVWNRRATKKGGRVNPPDTWVWSPEPTHEPIVTMEIYQAAASVAGTRKGSRNGSGRSSHPLARRSYVLRSFISCDICERRMLGKTLRRRPYYTCEPSKNLGPKAERLFPNHPPSIYVREEPLLEGILSFLAEHVFGPQRRPLIEEDLQALGEGAGRQREAEIAILRRQTEEIKLREARQVQALERDDDPEGIVFRRVRDRLAELERERSDKLERLGELEAQEAPGDRGNPELLDELPILDGELAEAPEPLLRRLFEALRLKVAYNKTTKVARCQVTVAADALDEVLAALGTIAFRAPNGIRTRASTLKG
ncbi:MAG: recombinase family protein [Actinomycetota bacterium]